MIGVDELVAAASTWVGVPFHHQGRSRHGVDCAGLPECVLRELGALPEGFAVPGDYGRSPTGELEEQLERWCVRVAAPVRGGLIALRWPRMARASHVAIFTGTDLIHAYRPDTGVVTTGYRGAWTKWTASAWLLPGVEYSA